VNNVGLKVIGVGPGDSELMTVKAVKVIEGADIILVPTKKEGSKESVALSIARAYIKDIHKVQYYYFPMKVGFDTDVQVQERFRKYGEQINQMVEAGKKVVFLTLGDPAIYSTYMYIHSYVKQVEYIPGIPSFIQGAAVAKQYLCLGDESLCVLSMTAKEEQLRQMFQLHTSMVVMKVSLNQPLLKELILESGKEAIFMSNIGLEDEQITRDIQVLDKKMPYFTIAIVRN